MKSMDLHTHTTFSDGKNTPEEMILAAIDAGMTTIGISDHSYTWFDPTYCIPPEKFPAYLPTLTALKEKYRGRINVLCGIEQDYYSPDPGKGFDYIIGGAHSVKCGDAYVVIDDEVSILADGVKRCFGGDFYSIAEAYYKNMADVVRKTNADMIAHFDLITKFIETDKLFDVDNPRYRRAWQSAADELLKTGKPFEVNTGAMSRGYRTSPYPSEEIQDYIVSHGGKLIAASDAHCTKDICHKFEELHIS